LLENKYGILRTRRDLGIYQAIALYKAAAAPAMVACVVNGAINMTALLWAIRVLFARLASYDPPP